MTGKSKKKLNESSETNLNLSDHDVSIAFLNAYICSDLRVHIHALIELLIEKGIITAKEFEGKQSEIEAKINVEYTLTK